MRNSQESNNLSTAKSTRDYSGMDRDDLMSLLTTRETQIEKLRFSQVKNSFNRNVFLNDESRQLFWTQLQDSENKSNERFEMMSKLQKSTQDNIHALQSQQKIIDLLVSHLKEDPKTDTDYEELYKQKTEEIEKLTNLVANLKSKAQSIKAITDRRFQTLRQTRNQVDMYEKKFDNIQSLFRKNLKDYVKERQGLTKKLKALSKEQRKRQTFMKITSDFRASEIFYSSENKIETVIIRMKTISPESRKYIELLGIIEDLYHMIEDALEGLGDKEVLSEKEVQTKRKCEFLRARITSEDMYLNYLKGLKAKDDLIYSKALDFILSLGRGYIKRYMEHFEKDEKIQKKIFEKMKSETIQYKRKKILIQLISFLTKLSRKFLEDFVILKGIEFIKKELDANTEPIYVNSDYYFTLLEILETLCLNKEYMKLTVSSSLLKLMVKLLRDCYNKNSIYKVLTIMHIICDQKTIRARLIELKVFQNLLKFYSESWESRNLSLLFHVFLLLAKFTREPAIRLHFIANLEVNYQFTGLFEPFFEENSQISTLEIKASALEIIKNLILNGPSADLKEAIAHSPMLKTVLMYSLDSGEVKLVDLALECLVSLTEVIEEGIMSLDDFKFDLNSIYEIENSAVRDKVLLLLGWGLHSNNLPNYVIRQGFVIKLVQTNLRALEEGAIKTFRMSNYVIIQLLEIRTWSEILQTMKYFYRFITAKKSAKFGILKNWLQGICLFSTFDFFFRILRANPDLIKIVNSEVKKNSSLLNQEIMVLLKSFIELPEVFNECEDQSFISKLLSSFSDSVDQYDNNLTRMAALEVFLALSRRETAIGAYLKNRSFQAYLKKIFKFGSVEMNIYGVRIFREMVLRGGAEQLKALFDEPFYDGFKAVFECRNELKINTFVSDIIYHLELKGVIPLGEFKKEAYTPDELNQPLFSKYSSKKILLDFGVRRLIEETLRSYNQTAL